MTNNEKIRNTFIKSPEEFLSKYHAQDFLYSKQLTSAKTKFMTKMHISQLATQFAKSNQNLNKFLASANLSETEKNYFVRYYIFADGDINNLPDELKNSASTKQLSETLQKQEKYIPKSIENEQAQL